MGGEIAAIGIIDPYIMVVIIVAITVNEHDGDLALLHLLIEAVRVHPNDNDPIQIPLLGQGQIALVGIGSRDEDMVTILARVVLDAAQHFAVKAILKHQPVSRLRLGNDHPDELGVLGRAAQRPRGDVGGVAQPLDGLLYPLARLLGNRSFPAQHIGDCRTGDTRLPGDILHGNAVR